MDNLHLILVNDINYTFMKRLYKYIYVILVTTLLVSCFKDKGNYEYLSLDDGEATGIEERYICLSNSKLTINPELKWESAKNITYEWSYYKDAGAYVEGPTYDKTVIQESKDLSWSVSLAPGTYTLRFKATADDGRFYAKEVKLSVSSVFSTGFYVMKELSGSKSDMDIHRPDGKITENCYNLTYNRHLEGKPVTLSQICTYYYVSPETNKKTQGQFIVPITDAEMKVLNTADNSTLREKLNDFFFSPRSKDEKLLGMFDMYYFVVMYTNKAIYSSSNQYPAAGGSGFFGNPVLINKTSDDYNITINPAMNVSNFNMWDDTSKGFLCATVPSQYAINLQKLSDYSSNSSIIISNLTNCDCKFIGYSNSGDWSKLPMEISLAVVDDKSDNKRYIYRIPAGGNALYSTKHITKYEVPTTYALKSANIFCTNLSGTQAMYYVANNELYVYYDEDNTEKKLHPKGLNKDEEITMIGTVFRSMYLAEPFNYFYIATYNSSKDEYTINLYNTVSAEPVGSPQKVLKGKGRAVKLQYINVDQNREWSSIGKFSLVI